ncbi:surface protein [Flagellimonas taeanensis]|uniref:Surface protein n=1 Tax=Flagellimonas taeanensis TaxID=1005926 RepID=A0A1M7BTH8_9FLAO|nr:BspA family leucine-rich repeat surface protein [Allomuricauda taeanensis]SFC49394.1 surface protein [Allomuricauda taeanensis]SHL58254.1 surface protein [Allomuricauda taeanensis]
MKNSMKKLSIVILAMALLWSCGKDDSPTPPKNSAPAIKAQEFSAFEGITDTQTIGTVVATDADKDALTFTIKTNDNALFEITAAGALSLAPGKTLNFATKAQHSITVEVSDGDDVATAIITIKVTQTTPQNTAPVIAAQEFNAFEGISDTRAIGTVVASDADNDALTFSIKTNDNDLFEITTAGELSLAAGKQLDFTTKEQHTITVEVSDGTDSASATITIKVTQTSPQNIAPEFTIDGELMEFTVQEDISDADVIGTVMATDADGDVLTFSIKTNSDDLFEITATGELSLAAGKSLDFETATGHNITVQVSDGLASTEDIVVILVEDVEEVIDPADDPNAFITIWKTDANNEEIVIGTNNAYTYNYTIHWGDGSSEQITSSEPVSHVYATAGNHTVVIQGEFPAIRYIDGVTTSSKLLSIEQWGTITWKSMNRAFAYCTNMTYNATDIPNLSQVSNMAYAFYRTDAFNGAIGDWDTSHVTDMSYMFQEAAAFDQNLGGWNISNVTNMSNMFNNSGMSTLNYSETLLGWSNQDNVPVNITLGATGLSIDCENATYWTAFQYLLAKPWTINDNSPCH